MKNSQLQDKPVPISAVIELSDESRIILPNAITLLLIRWIESLTVNGFSNVRIKSERLKYEIRIEMEAGSIVRQKIELHQADSLKKALSSCGCGMRRADRLSEDS